MATEAYSEYPHLDKMSTLEILQAMNQEDHKVAPAVKKAIPQIESLVEAVLEKMLLGGRLFYLGAGTSGRLGIVDASECPPTFGVPPDLVIGLMAGGDGAIRQAVEFAEDDPQQAWRDLQKYHLQIIDSVIGIAASGTTTYVVEGIKKATTEGMTTGAITCNYDTPLAKAAQYPIEVDLGPEFLTGSTRLKSGSAQKMILNMITTSLMIRMGRVKGNKMVDMQLTNKKLHRRAIQFIMDEVKVDAKKAEALLQEYGSLRGVLDHLE
jgi:N-acetylmuramic acid 6-phosphate etherase